MGLVSVVAVIAIFDITVKLYTIQCIWGGLGILAIIVSAYINIRNKSSGRLLEY